MKVMYDKVTLIGLGLIASSMGHAMKKIGLANETCPIRPSPKNVCCLKDFVRSIY